MITNHIVCYLLPAVLWTAYSLRMQYWLYGKTTKVWQYCLVAMINVCLWPVAMVLAAWRCPGISDKPNEPAVKTWRKLD